MIWSIGFIKRKNIANEKDKLSLHFCFLDIHMHNVSKFTPVSDKFQM